MRRQLPASMSNLPAIRDEFVQLWGRLGSFWGVPPTTARIHGYLLARSGPADAEEISSALQLSRGAVSTGCRELRDWGLLKVSREAGSRKDAYEAETDVETAIRNIVQVRKRREWDPILQSLREWIPQLEKERAEEARIFASRLQQLETVVGLADSMAERFLAGGTVQRLGLKALVGAAGKLRSRKRS